MALLQKMGWQPGEGLGKNKEGTLEPLKLEVKMDKKGIQTFFFLILINDGAFSYFNCNVPFFSDFKGLLAADELKKGKGKGVGVQQGPLLPTVKTLDGM